MTARPLSIERIAVVFWQCRDRGVLWLTLLDNFLTFEIWQFLPGEHIFTLLVKLFDVKFSFPADREMQLAVRLDLLMRWIKYQSYFESFFTTIKYQLRKIKLRHKYRLMYSHGFSLYTFKS